MSDESDKVDGQRRAIREHIEKYKRFTVPYEKQTALRTIDLAQREISNLKRRKPSIRHSWEDSWRP
ncbi:hypothetical protein [Micromonospora sp. CPCC 205558]|uniref:hypothetical protein n=1 Tax=Micromonospora sp. CPCC 205558 TaxID=3122403 RepID=UPI002FF28BE7